MIAVAESARNIVCSGGKPIAITNCLNFGNPYKPEVYWQFKEAVAGMGEACLAFDTPVTGGNVSFYNESPNAAVFPTPTIGMLGLIDKKEHITTSNFKYYGDAIFLLGEIRGDISGSEFLAIEHGITAGDAPYFNLQTEVRLQECCLELITSGLLHSAHDISDGGLITALLESSFTGKNKFGFNVSLNVNTIPFHNILFGEEQSRIIISAEQKSEEALNTICSKHNIVITKLGNVTDNLVGIINKDFTIDIMKAFNLYHNTIHQKIEQHGIA
jgi:phosphoribosylformylglycinamidine synthase